MRSLEEYNQTTILDKEIKIPTELIWPEVMEAIIVESFGKRLKKIRNTLGMTQEELANLAGFKVSAISHFETGIRDPSLRNIVRICRALHCKPNALIDV